MFKDIKKYYKEIMGAEYGSKEKQSKSLLWGVVIFLALAVGLITLLVSSSLVSDKINKVMLWYCAILFAATSLWIFAFYFYTKAKNSDKCAPFKKCAYLVASFLLGVIFSPAIVIIVLIEKSRLSISSDNIICYVLISVFSMIIGILGIAVSGVLLEREIKWQYLDLGKCVVLFTLLLIYIVGKLILLVWGKITKKKGTDEYIGVKGDLSSLWYAVMVIIAILINICAIPMPWSKVVTSINGIFVIYFAFDKLIIKHKQTHGFTETNESKN